MVRTLRKEGILKRTEIIMSAHGLGTHISGCSCYQEMDKLIEDVFLLGMQKKEETVIQKRKCPYCSMRSDFQRDLVGNKDECFCPNESCPIRFFEA